MGGLFGGGRVPSMPAPIPAPPAPEDPEKRRREDRLEMLRRRARGRQSLLQTGPAGLLGGADLFPGMKSLLGE